MCYKNIYQYCQHEQPVAMLWQLGASAFQWQPCLPSPWPESIQDALLSLSVNTWVAVEAASGELPIESDTPAVSYQAHSWNWKFDRHLPYMPLVMYNNITNTRLFLFLGGKGSHGPGVILIKALFIFISIIFKEFIY